MTTRTIDTSNNIPALLLVWNSIQVVARQKNPSILYASTFSFIKNNASSIDLHFTGCSGDIFSGVVLDMQDQNRSWNFCKCVPKSWKKGVDDFWPSCSLSGTSSTSSIDSPLSLFNSRLKTFLFCKSFPSQPFLFFFRTDYMDYPDFYCYFWAYPFLLFSLSVLQFLVVVSVR